MCNRFLNAINDIMKTYKTISTIDFTKSVVISFDVKVDKNDYIFGVGYEGGNILFKGQNKINLEDLPDLISNTNKIIEFSLSSNKGITDDLIVIEGEPNNLLSDKDISFFKNENKELCLKNTNSPIEDNKLIYKKIEDASSEEAKNLIVLDDEIYKIADEFTPTSYCLSSDINDEENFILKIKDDGFNLDLLNVDITATRDLESYPISQILQQVISINSENSEKYTSSISEISNGSKFENEQNRIRFVFTNGGRLLNISCYNSDKKIYETLGSYSFTQSLNESKIYVYNSSSTISNVSTNF